MPRLLANSPLLLLSVVLSFNFVIHVSATPISEFTTISHPSSSGISSRYAGSRRDDTGKDSFRNYLGELGSSSMTIRLDQIPSPEHHDEVFIDAQCDPPSEYPSESKLSMRIFDLVGGYSVPTFSETAIPQIFQSLWTKLLRYWNISEPTSISGKHAGDISQVSIQETGTEIRRTCDSNGITSKRRKEIELGTDKLLVLFNDILY